ncbi:MAG: hypothetical protein COA79_23835 [Planctomycetota bacterium]|nr:MAG: hypothetical protein COA79_23835 [Planctomycetota bacterium]
MTKHDQYQNPIIDAYLADPYIFVADDFYYLVASGKAMDTRYLPIYRSSDLVKWEFIRGAVSFGKEGAWNRKNFWAPEVTQIDGKFYLYYTASDGIAPKNTGNRVGLAVSDAPDGPYEDLGVVVSNASLDGSPFRDIDGTLYLYYTVEYGNSDGLVAGQIYVDQLITPQEVAGKPKLIMGDYPWQEGPCVLYSNESYYLTFSLGSWGKGDYEVHWSVSDSSFGPFLKEPNPLLSSTDSVKGPGHHNFFVDKSGKNWIVYHGWDNDFTARYPRIDPLIIGDKNISTIGPTS